MLKKLLDKYPKNSDVVLHASTFDSPVGKVVAVADEEYIYLVAFEETKNLDKKLDSINKTLTCSFEVNDKNKTLQLLQKQMKEYFSGSLKRFTLPLKLVGSDFQKDVWQKLQETEYATTQTYGDLAQAMGRSASHARAIGAACGANAHLVVIPCHRLIASSSKGGFNSGGDLKEWLLEHEQKHAN